MGFDSIADEKWKAEYSILRPHRASGGFTSAEIDVKMKQLKRSYNIRTKYVNLTL
jgi:hypothetical protein